MPRNTPKGFTLLEILLVVAAIAILAGIVIVAINPSKQLAETRNAQRRVDVNTVLNAVYQYMIDNNGTIPGVPVIPTATPPATCLTVANNEVCKTGTGVTCTNLINFATTLTQNEKYLTAMPLDPSGPIVANTNGTGYRIVKTPNGRITVCAPKTEPAGSPAIIVTR